MNTIQTLKAAALTTAMTAAFLLSSTPSFADAPVATTPSEVVTTFEALFKTNDLDAIMASLYDDDSIMLGQPGAPAAADSESIRAILAGFTSVGKNASIKPKTVLQTGDTALVVVEWSMDVPNGEGGMMAINGVGTEVVRQRIDGSWYYLIDNPYGVNLYAN